MLPTDERSEWNAWLLTDERVTHYWDDGRLVGNWYGPQTKPGCDTCIVWDTYYLYAGQSEIDGEPMDWIDTEHTIFARRQQLRETIAPLLED